MNVPDIALNDGHTIPQLGLGTWQSKDMEAFATALKEAFKAGYRHIDTAQAYGNEQMLGEAWMKSKIPREELYITTKIQITNFGHKKLHDSFDESLKKLQTDYVDLLLLHFPVPIARKKAWQMLEDIHTSGMARSIGVSNYTIRHLEELKTFASVTPAVNQVELHVFLQQPELIEYCLSGGIQVEAYSPLARARIMDNDVIMKIADKHNKTYAQVMLRWLIQQGLIVIPKSVTPKRIEENIDVFDFELDEEDMKEIAKLDQNKRFCWSPVNVP